MVFQHQQEIHSNMNTSNNDSYHEGEPLSANDASKWSSNGFDGT